MSKTLPHFDDDQEESKSFEPIETVEQHTTATIMEEGESQKLQDGENDGSVRNNENNRSVRNSTTSFPCSPDISALPSRSTSFNDSLERLMEMEDKAALADRGVGVGGGSMQALAAGVAATSTTAPGTPGSSSPLAGMYRLMQELV